ncbi:ankyrin repeat-containing domain protein, partial [Aspergillus fruticulosus]
MMASKMGHLPSELILLIAEHLDVPSINFLLQTCQRFHGLLDPLLYELARRYRSVPGAGTPLIWAVKNDHVSVIKRLLEGGSWPSDNENGTTALHEAIDVKNEEALRLLLSAGANVFAENKIKDAALHTAIKCEYELAARLIISVYPAVAPWENYSWHWTEALLQAAAKMSESLCRLALDYITREYPDHAPDLLTSALHTAAAPTGHLGIIHLLCDYGANPLASAPGGTTTLLHTFA